MLVLKGNNPRFPWEPSFAMLSNRLTGTTDSSAFYRDGQAHFAQPAAAALTAATGDRDAKNLRSSRRARRALSCCQAI